MPRPIAYIPCSAEMNTAVLYLLEKFGDDAPCGMLQGVEFTYKSRPTKRLYFRREMDREGLRLLRTWVFTHATIEVDE
jgi:hypothetical protein